MQHVPQLADEGGFQGYIYLHPNGLRANLLCPNAYADAKKMISMMNPILDKLSTFPGIDTKSLFKISPFDLTNINLGGLLAGARGKPNATNITASSAPWGTALPPKQTTSRRRRSKRHTPGGEDVMEMPMGILDQDS